MMSIMRLLDENGKVKEGEVIFENKDLANLTEKEMSKIRGNDISIRIKKHLQSHIYMKLQVLLT